MQVIQAAHLWCTDLLTSYLQFSIHTNRYTILRKSANKCVVKMIKNLYLSAAFDTIDHTILLNRLKSTFGISDSAFSMVSSYLCNRSQSVAVHHEYSPTLSLLRGVPQGSVLGPLLFSLYTTPLSNILA